MLITGRREARWHSPRNRVATHPVHLPAQERPKPETPDIIASYFTLAVPASTRGGLHAGVKSGVQTERNSETLQRNGVAEESRTGAERTGLVGLGRGRREVVGEVWERPARVWGKPAARPESASGRAARRYLTSGP